MYKLKHIPTGLYYQPHKSGGSNFSKKGKVYQTSAHGLSSSMRRAEAYPNDESKQLFSVYVKKDSPIHKILVKDNILTFTEVKYYYNQMMALTKVSDWEKEYVYLPKTHTYE